MATPATASSLDVAYWFFNRAEQDDLYLETEKIHPLLFMAQNRYAKQYSDRLLMPCVFLCDENGFYEPTLKRIFAQGRPFMQPSKIENHIVAFLEEIWQEYGNLSLSQFSQLMTRMPCYNQCRLDGNPILSAEMPSTEKAEKFQTTTSERLSREASRKKVLVSQNGPVLVSQWTPRKINSHSDKASFNE